MLWVHNCGSSLCTATGLDLWSTNPEYKLIFLKKKKPCPFESGLSATDMLKVSNENNMIRSLQDHEISAVLGDLGYPRRQ